MCLAARSAKSMDPTSSLGAAGRPVVQLVTFRTILVHEVKPARRNPRGGVRVQHQNKVSAWVRRPIERIARRVEQCADAAVGRADKQVGRYFLPRLLANGW